jgi:hypothetical protein
MMHVYAAPSLARAEPRWLKDIGQNAWVAEVDDRLVGMAVISIENQSLARLTCLYAAGEEPQLAPAALELAEIAIRKAWHAGYLKLVVYTDIPDNHLIECMHLLGFEFARRRTSGGQRLVEFYRNLYEQPRSLAPKPEKGVESAMR